MCNTRCDLTLGAGQSFGVPYLDVIFCWVILIDVDYVVPYAVIFLLVIFQDENGIWTRPDFKDKTMTTSHHEPVVLRAMCVSGCLEQVGVIWNKKKMEYKVCHPGGQCLYYYIDTLSPCLSHCNSPEDQVPMNFTLGPLSLILINFNPNKGNLSHPF